MARVRFDRDYMFTPSADRRVTVAYKAGSELTVTRECADKAIAAGAAEELDVPSRAAGKGKGGQE